MTLCGLRIKLYYAVLELNFGIMLCGFVIKLCYVDL